ncbi:hypothetical protein JK635_01850 [Neobacillus sp. YIM B02564]|uniref:HK97 gp10 family phage protein n=1 Tax=Neobacillus paridis TaxID=2803862 RepID=A0ABS1TI91_9BACI|nr:hypothetical protein [Neobacillus paridis]MBL4950982.1 hypothetical protein [Neobacillus paridis]
MEFKSTKDLEKYINRIVVEAMSKGNAVKNTVIEEGKKQVQETVYNVYPEPKVYIRTGKLKESWNWQDAPDGIEIINTRTDEESGKYIPSVVESGKGYDYTGYGYDYEKPRPFIDNTIKNLEGSAKLTEALKQDLRKQGISVE